MRRPGDYVYCNTDDSLRVRVFRRATSRWDYDVFYPSGKVTTFSEDAGDDFHTKRDALAWADHEYGPLHSIAVGSTVTDKAWYDKNAARMRRARGGSPGPFGGPGAGPQR